MNHNAPGNQGEESLPLPENDESKRHKKQRKSKRSHMQNGRENSAGNIESGRDLENGNSREYSADDLSEAVIWVREFDPNDTSVKPLINTEQYLASQKIAAKSETPNKSEQPSQTSKNNSRNAVSQKIEHYDLRMSSEQIDDADSGYLNHEPDKSPERNYFWNQADIYQPQGHEMLPNITKSDNQGQNSENIENLYDAGINDDATLAEAVNPNDPSYVDHEPVRYQEKTVVKPRKNQKSGFMARRREKRAVQSQQMEGETFDRIASTSPYNELIPEEMGPVEAVRDTYEQPAILNDEISRPAEVADRPTSRYPEMPVSKQKEKVEESYAERGSDHPDVELSLEKTEQLDLARSIHIDSVSVYEMFTAGRIDEAGLHRIIVEFLRGGDLRDVIKSEIIRQQLKFERDPQLRDTPVDKKAPSKARTSKIKSRTKSIIDPVRNRDRTEKLAELTQKTIEKSHEYLDDNPKAGQMMSIAAIVVIYLTILIVAIAK
ncbi:MAG TPA: hypothetical protein VLG47_03260 [Candidatus Saccharimonadales bacterium]|nr:hypothetical protein [Candidatus Saccharimonadales bacterium]